MKKEESGKWLKEQEFLFYKKWNELMRKIHWNTYRLNEEVDNENTKLWKEIRRNN